MENRISRDVWLKTYLRFSINYRTLNSSSKIAELINGLILKYTTFSASSLFHRFLLSARSGSKCYYINCRTQSARIAHHNTITVLYTLCTPFLPKAQTYLNSGTQIHTMHYYIAGIYPVLMHWWGVYAILLLR